MDNNNGENNTPANLLFALDIGTRSVIGLVGEQLDNSIKILHCERQEHHTRAMLDGQIHDVMEVASVLSDVKTKLEKSCGPLKMVSVAAAGRALCTIKASAEIESSGRGVLSPSDERSLELAAIQNAQRQLATSQAIPDPTSYYCVGYSVIKFSLDHTVLKSLVGQRGRLAAIEVIATFLPRQVIDSLQSAVETVGLEISTLTLEPIAAINVLIPPTMRHLNLTLVDVGAGTSDVAITRDGSVIAYGMVPFAGDEITEAISQAYLLDFNVAEGVKRQLNETTQNVSFTDVLGLPQEIPVKDILDSISTKVCELAQAIAAQIVELNGSSPQAVLLVGGGSLTPLLAKTLAEALELPPARVAIRRPDAVENIVDIPPDLCTPDAVTPLGILKLANSRTLHFVNVTLNNEPLHLFNLGSLTIADALLTAGLDIRNLRGRPGLGITICINGETKFIPGTHHTPGKITLNGEQAELNAALHENDIITVAKGTDGSTPAPPLNEVAQIPAGYQVKINEDIHQVTPFISVNKLPADPNTKLKDRDDVSYYIPYNLEDVLKQAGQSSECIDYFYTMNGTERIFSLWPKYTIIRNQAEITAIPSTKIQPNDKIALQPLPKPTIGELLGMAEEIGDHITITFNGKKHTISTRQYTFRLNGAPAELSTVVPSGSNVEYSCTEQPAPMLSSVLLAVKFDPRTLPNGKRVDTLINGQHAEYTAPVKNGDSIEVVVIN
ncbi:MAG: rod shape-determining protein [Pelosinus sp.]|nr:rod shape-determining protein [Pelosinus sp.]